MQVKKFEARTMKEALDMVKKELGPEAIILSAKDNGKRSGILAQTSVEVTAAISEMALNRKQFAESKMNTQTKQQFQSASASSQKKLVNKFVENWQSHTAASTASASTASASTSGTSGKYAEQKNPIQKSYIDIYDDEPLSIETQNKSNAKIILNSEAPQHKEPQFQFQFNDNKNFLKTDDILDLKNEINQLKSMIQSLKNSSTQNEIKTIPPQSENLPTELASTYKKLVRAGVSESQSNALISEVQKELSADKLNNKVYIEGWLVRYLIEQIKCAQPKNKIQIFMGPQGSGKTSSMIKWASYLLLEKKKRIALVTSDHNKIGSDIQMRQFAKILNVPFSIVRKSSDWNYYLRELSDVDYILCDLQGMSLKDDSQVLELKSILPLPDIQYDSILVMSSVMNHGEMKQTFLKYLMLKPNHLIFSHMDECTEKGLVFELSHKYKIPFFALGVGPKIPDDFEIVTKERIVDFVLQISTQGGRDAHR